MTTTTTLSPSQQRVPVSIDRGLIRAGSRTTTFDDGTPEVLLRNYLRLIRRARRAHNADTIPLRREDIDILARHLGMSAEHVLHRLADLMGSSRTQRTTMLAVFASGALLIGLSGSVAAVRSQQADQAPVKPPVASGQLADTPAPQLTVAEIPAATTATTVTATTVTATTVTATTAPTATVPAVPSVPPAAEAVPATSPAANAADPRPHPPRTPVAPQPPASDDASVATAAPPVPAAAPTIGPARSVGTPAGTGALPGTELATLDPSADVNVADPNVAVGDPVVVPTTTPTTVPGPDDTVADDVIPTELPPVDENSVAVGSPPIPPSATSTSTSVVP